METVFFVKNEEDIHSLYSLLKDQNTSKMKNVRKVEFLKLFLNIEMKLKILYLFGQIYKYYVLGYDELFLLLLQ